MARAAARQLSFADVELMRQTLAKRNFSIEVADEETTANASKLDQKIAAFCARSVRSWAS